MAVIGGSTESHVEGRPPLQLCLISALICLALPAHADEPLSRIAVHASLPFATLATVLNRDVPREFNGERGDPLGNPVKDDVLTWTINRGEIAVSSDNGVLVLSAPLTGTARVKGRVKVVVKIPFSAHADVRARATARLKPELHADWSISPNIELAADVDEAVIPVNNIGDISVRTIMREELGKQLVKLSDQLNTEIARDRKLQTAAAKLWSELCRSEPFAVGTGVMSLRIEPRHIVAANPVISGTQIDFGLGVEAAIQMSPGALPPPNCATTVPALDLVELADTGAFIFTAPVQISWQALSAEITRQISGQPIGLVTAVALKLTAKADGVFAQLDYTSAAGPGSAYAKAGMALEGSTVAFKNLVFTNADGKPRTGIIDAAQDALMAAAIGSPRFNLEPELAKAQDLANAQLGKLSAKLSQRGIAMDIAVQTLEVSKLAAEASGLALTAAASGTASVAINDLSFE